MSTRVHELAKELGLKSPELLDRIQKWGLDVKVSALASLDPSTVERIRELMKQPTAGKETRGESVAEFAVVSAEGQTATAAKLTPRPVATVAAPSAATSAPSMGGPAVARPTGTGPVAPRATGPLRSSAVETPMPGATASSPAPAVRPSAPPTSPVSFRPVATAAPSPGLPRAVSEASAAAPSTDG
ncbi:MAG: translation initiation factor IF-2 N-terminal domain-containing protein, partial [Planctomycetaceae bacterium]|nr:translation initiation factor IF-2 N-terminal domain-containing protein [Planctomycetaceae bacterium]